jgi:hypothetical protein
MTTSFRCAKRGSPDGRSYLRKTGLPLRTVERSIRNSRFFGDAPIAIDWDDSKVRFAMIAGRLEAMYASLRRSLCCPDRNEATKIDQVRSVLVEMRQDIWAASFEQRTPEPAFRASQAPLDIRDGKAQRRRNTHAVGYTNAGSRSGRGVCRRHSSAGIAGGHAYTGGRADPNSHWHCQTNRVPSAVGTVHPIPSGDQATTARHSAMAAERLPL